MTDTTPLPLHNVPKKCKCGAEWIGKSFKPAPADGKPVKYTCDDCIKEREEKEKKLANKGVLAVQPDLELTVPKQVGQF